MTRTLAGLGPTVRDGKHQRPGVRPGLRARGEPAADRPRRDDLAPASGVGGGILSDGGPVSHEGHPARASSSLYRNFPALGADPFLGEPPARDRLRAHDLAEGDQLVLASVRERDVPLAMALPSGDSASWIMHADAIEGISARFDRG